MDFHSLSIKKTIEVLGTDIKKGLSEKKVKERRKKFGANKLPKEKPLSKIRLFLAQLKSPLIYILLLAGLITSFFGKYTDSIVILGAVILNTIVGYFQEDKASQALQKLKRVLKIKTIVFRDGQEKQIPQEALVPGDIFLLRAGDKVAADGRLIETKELEVNESLLTGEWLPAKKDTKRLPKKTILADRQNMVYLGCLVENGWAKAVVTGIGQHSEVGKIAGLLRETKEAKTPLQKKLARFSKIIGGIIVLVCLFIFIGGISTGRKLLEMFEMAVAVAVAAIPEGLPISLTVILALGMQRILKKRGLVRRLSSAETLGSTSIICTDKTGTLTQAKMEVAAVLTSSTDQASYLLALKIAVLCNEAFIENPDEPLKKWLIRGRPTERGLLRAGLQAGLSRQEIEKQQPRIDELLFDPVYRYSATLHQYSKEENILYIMGAPELLLKKSKFLELNDQQVVLSKERVKELTKKYEDLAAKGQRVLATAYRRCPITSQPDNLDKLFNRLTFVGFIALHDPIRQEAKRAIKVCRQAGLRPIIVTGDHRLTALAVAKELGFQVKEENILEGWELAKISADDLRKKLNKIQIYARVEPAQKLKIIEAWQQKGEVVAMTGDGVNDAPALKKADIGLALGSGSEIAKEVSDIVLLTDNFSIIVAAVEQGRAILSNMRKVITYLLSDSFTEVILVAVSLLFGLPLPILPVQILWVNLIEDGLPDIALALEPKERGLMKEKPQPQKAPLLTAEMKSLIFIIGFLTDIFLLGIFLWLLKYSGYSLTHIRTIIFAALTIDSLFYVFSCKSLKRNLWHINPLSNKFLIFAWLFGFLMLFVALYLPSFQALLKTVPLSGFDWLILIGLGIINLALIEGTKWVFIRKRERREKMGM